MQSVILLLLTIYNYEFILHYNIIIYKPDEYNFLLN